MKIKTLFTIISFFSFVVVMGFSYYNYKTNYNLLIKNKELELQKLANGVRYNVSAMLDKMMVDFIEAQESNQKIYNEVVDKILTNPNLTLDDIKQEYGPKYPDRTFDFYLINNEYTIYNTTYKPDLGLDFKKIPNAYKTVHKTYLTPGQIDISNPIGEFILNSYLQYYLIRPKNKNFMIQMSVRFDKKNLIQSYYDNIVKMTPNLIDFYIYHFWANDGSNQIAKVIHKSFNEKKIDIHHINKNDQITNSCGESRFSKIYEDIFHKSMPKDSKIVDNDLNQLLLRNNGYITLKEIDNNNYYESILLPIANAITLKDKPLISQYMVIEIDNSEIMSEIKNFQYKSILFTLFYLSVVSIILYIVYRKILLPIYLLDESMQQRNMVDKEKYNSKNDEISNMMRSYNHLLDNLNSEIDTTCQLLNENKRFIADTVHQIKTPLTVIMLNSEMVKVYQNDKVINSFLDEINASIIMLSNSYEDLAYITSYDHIEYQLKNINLSQFLSGRIKFFHIILKVNHKEILSNIEDDIFININEIELERIIDNNISNGIKYGNRNQPITINLYKSNNTIILEFKTYGKPIINKEKVFEKNYRENEAKRGLGLGLNMVKNICEKYDILYKVSYEDEQNIFTYMQKLE